MSKFTDEIAAALSGGLPTERDVVGARYRRASGSKSPDDVLLDRFGTGQEMGLLGVPVGAVYEASKPALAASPSLNKLVGSLFGPEQMVDETTQRPTAGQAVRNVGGIAAGALSNWLMR
jgi:hypothetical protein